MKKYIEYTTETKIQQVQNMIWTAESIEDIFEAIKFQYGLIVPLYHATTKDNAKIIEKEGLKLTYGKNRLHFGKQLNLYFQIGRCDYKSDVRPIVFKYNSTIDFLHKYSLADMDSISANIDDVNKKLGRDIYNDVESFEVSDFILSFFNNNNKLEGLELLILSDEEMTLKVKRVTEKIKLN